jgi:site-specific DNA-methyltransferase (adenine-specific)
MSTYSIYEGDCLEVMKQIPDKSVDCILCDLPYGTTSCKWDNTIPFDKLWDQYKRIRKDNAPIILFGTEPFSSSLRLSNIKEYKYDLYWVKEKPTNFLQLKKRFGKLTENICIFYKSQPTYNPQKYTVDFRHPTKPRLKNNSSIVAADGFSNIQPYKDDGTRYPCDILHFNRVPLGKSFHPTQKPVPLLEYLIKTFTNEGDLVLDNCMGSGSTGVACINTDRDFVGIELDDKYFQIADNRLREAMELSNESNSTVV